MFVFLGLKFISLSMTRNCRNYFHVRLVRNKIRQYGRRGAYSYRHFIILNTETMFHKFYKVWSSCPLEYTFVLEWLPCDLTSHCRVWRKIKWQTTLWFGQTSKVKREKTFRLKSNKILFINKRKGNIFKSISTWICVHHRLL